ncbi:MAG: 1-deoxy-D-xylulose-5-phosphate reductoisomerase [Thermodesulfobacteriota bacterium]
MPQRKRKGIAVLGSTGSIGQSTLRVVDRYPERFRIVAMAGGRNVERMAQQVLQFRPLVASMADREAVEKLRSMVRGKVHVELLHGEEGLEAVATYPEADMVVLAMVGSAGLAPTMAAIRAHKDLALANKETLVMAGRIVTQEARSRGVRILPVDSEHSAIFQALQGHRKEDVRRIILTASGGAFLGLPLERLEEVTPEQAVVHPNWKMGQKVTVDSASLMNKALEVIEARWLFDIPASRIEVHIHPQSVVHSMVEYIDGSVIAQMGIPDMQLPIAYALSYPERLKIGLPPLDLLKVGPLTFMAPDPRRFPALGLAYQVLEAGGTLPAVLNGANEEAVLAFLRGEIRFTRIVDLVRRVVESHPRDDGEDLDAVMEADRMAREKVRSLILAER